MAERVQTGGRKLPADLRRAAERLAQAEAMAWQPKLLVTLDDRGIDKDYRLIVKRIETAQGRGMGAQMLSSAASAVLSLALIGLGVLGWTFLH